MPAAEAMACGSYVIGNHGQGGREFFLPEFSTAIEAGDTLAFARAVEEGKLRRILREFERPPVPVSLVHAGQGLMPLKTRSFLEFAAPRLRKALA